MFSQGDIHDLFRNSTDEPWIGQAGYMLGLGFDQNQIRENLELRYTDPSLYQEFVAELERTLGVEVVDTSSDPMSFYDPDGETVRIYNVQVEGSNDGFKTELKRAYNETVALRPPENPSGWISGLSERHGVLANIIQKKVNNGSSSGIDQKFVWDVYELVLAESFTRNTIQYFTQQLVVDGLIFKDGSTIYPEPLLTESENIIATLPEIGVISED